jgi:hypothetical protein
MSVVITPELQGHFQVGLPADEPEEALAVLVEHFKTRPDVRLAVLGLIRFVDAPPPLTFSYTIGITCPTDKQREEEEALAADALAKASVSSSRWPISFLPPRTRFFHAQARRFYPVKSEPAQKGFLSRLFG